MMVLIHSQIEWQARYRTGVQFQSVRSDVHFQMR